MARKYTVDFFLKKFSKIPVRRWTTAVFEKEGRRCALGHCGVKAMLQLNPQGKALAEIFGWLPNAGLETKADRVAEINDKQPNYAGVKGKTPRTRILNALRMAKKIEAQAY
jgi:hypothetical protein